MIEWNQSDVEKIETWRHNHNMCLVWRRKILREKFAIKLLENVFVYFSENNCYVMQNKGIVWPKR